WWRTPPRRGWRKEGPSLCESSQLQYEQDDGTFCRPVILSSPSCRRLGRVGADVNLHAPVELAAVGRAVGGAGLRLAVADAFQARAADAELLEVVHHAVRAPLGEPLVVRGGADGVGVAGHFDGGVRVLLEHVGHLAERLARGR